MLPYMYIATFVFSYAYRSIFSFSHLISLYLALKFSEGTINSVPQL
jgi:hypothetical protein